MILQTNVVRSARSDDRSPPRSAFPAPSARSFRWLGRAGERVLYSSRRIRPYKTWTAWCRSARNWPWDSRRICRPSSIRRPGRLRLSWDADGCSTSASRRTSSVGTGSIRQAKGGAETQIGAASSCWRTSAPGAAVGERARPARAGGDSRPAGRREDHPRATHVPPDRRASPQLRTDRATALAEVPIPI